MEQADILSLWKSYDKKLDESLHISRKNVEDITTIKVHSLLDSMKPIKIFTLIVGIAWVGFIDMLIINLWNYASHYFLVSAIIQVVLTKAAIAVYLYQLILIWQTDVSTPVLETQERLSRLTLSTLWITKLLFLQLPVWTTFYLHEAMIQNGGTIFIIIQILVSGLFTLAALWLFRNIRYQNRDKKWFRMIFAGKEWTPLMKSMELLEQVKELKRNQVV